MKMTLPTLPPGSLPGHSPLGRKPSSTDVAFYFLMASLALGLLYFLLLPLFL